MRIRSALKVSAIEPVAQLDRAAHHAALSGVGQNHPAGRRRDG